MNHSYSFKLLCDGGLGFGKGSIDFRIPEKTEKQEFESCRKFQELISECRNNVDISWKTGGKGVYSHRESNH